MPKFKVGTDDFKELRDEGGYFVDKSLLIKEVIDGSKALLLPRPRRFGKTLHLSMLRYFFEQSTEDRSYLFQDLAIASMVPEGDGSRLPSIQFEYTHLPPADSQSKCKRGNKEALSL